MGSKDLGGARTMGEKESKALMLNDREKQAITEAKSNSAHGSSKAMYKCNTNKVFHSASKAEDVFRVLLVLKLVLQLGSSVSLLVQEPL
ncbi:hypothetical protein Tco_0396602 [Tanacetum coccineum]